MSHYAKVLDGRVTQVIVAEPEFFNTFIDTTPGTWIQTSYNTYGNQHKQGGTPLRGNYAGIGYTYDQVHDVFYQPKPYTSWTLNHDTWVWEAPTPYPDDQTKKYQWDEATLTWVEYGS
jgi:hypothetical protein